jgi:phosphatidylinositol glycan class N
MLAIGIAYIAFEDRIIEQLPETKEAEKASGKPLITQTVFGAQVGLIVLAMIVTRSGIAAVATREGLPLGTQVAGWLTLSTYPVLPPPDPY